MSAAGRPARLRLVVDHGPRGDVRRTGPAPLLRLVSTPSVPAVRPAAPLPPRPAAA